MGRLVAWLLAPLARRRARRRAARDLDARLAAWAALPPEEQRKWIHPSSPLKPEGWTAEGFRETRRRRYDA